MVSLAGSEFQNLTVPVNFRLYVWGNQGGSSGSAWALDSLAVNGTITAIPEPGSFALILVSGLTLVCLRRRLRR